MNISFLRPKFLWLLILVIFFVIYVLKKSSLLKNNLDKNIFKNSSSKFLKFSSKEIYVRILIKGFSRIAAFIFLILALAGISWGSVSTPVQKTGKSCAFVFDISYSMLALDMPKKMSRLKASSEYASKLLDYMNSISVSCVLAKGDGIIAIPQTEDFKSVNSLLEILSPTMMSSQGSFLGRGVEAAIKSFPQNSSKSSMIIIFTDGDETDLTLQNAISKAVKLGIDVCIVGFGSTNEIEIISGDGKTSVKTALREEKLLKICDEINLKNTNSKNFSFVKSAKVNYVNASEVGSAVKILYEIKNIPHGKKYLTAKELLNFENNPEENITISYETQKVDRHKIFIFLSILFLIISIFASQFSFKNLKMKILKFNSTNFAILILPIFLLISSGFLFTSCGQKIDEGKLIFESTWDWFKKDYNKSISGFSKAIQVAEENHDDTAKQYALYGLSVTYLMQNEKAASLEKLEQISPDAPPKIRFASYYNSGIIEQQGGNYEKAQEYFKKALLIMPENIDAKVNLELSQNHESQKSKSGEQEMISASENNSAEENFEKSIFNRMKENDKKQWKNYDTPEKNNSVIDY